MFVPTTSIHAPQTGQLALYNTLGQLVWSVRAIPSGYNAFNLPNNLAQGMYYYHFTPNHPEEEKPVIVGRILLVGVGSES
ncbi:MAG TPA: gliding motility-associated C-terminal domain-containing protein [Chitinophagales bacterium]|nr:gliding motility-associated C-terminal domain-containing protein [Chitinophagales bacterium]